MRCRLETLTRPFRSAVVLTSMILSFSYGQNVQAQTCTTSPNYNAIPNFRTTAFTSGVSWTFAWDAVPGVTDYDVMVTTSPDSCLDFRKGIVLLTTTATTYTVSLAQRDTNFLFWVREHTDVCAQTGFYYRADTFLNAPQRPPVPTVATGGGLVTATINGYNDSHVGTLWLERAGSDGKFKIVAGTSNCPAGSPLKIYDYGYDNLPPGVYQYRLRAENFTGSATSDPVTVTVGPAQPLAITSFTALPTTIRPSQSVTLSWVTTGAPSVLIDNGIGTKPGSGSTTVSPKTTTTYTLTAMQGATTLTSTVTVEVLTTPAVNLISVPSAMLQLAGSGGAISQYALTNSGGISTAITLARSGNFFTQSPSSFTLVPGATQVVTISGLAQASGSYEGTSIVSGSGVPADLQIPVKLLSVSPTSGIANAQASAPRVDVAALPSILSPPPPITGSASFMNTGNAPLTGILTADVPWIIPQSGVVTIDPGTTASFTFAIDRSKRPDGSALIGSVEGNLVLTFLGGRGPSSGKRSLDTPPPPSTPSVSIVKVVDTVQPPVTASGIPSLAAGEVALFVSGAGHVTGSNGRQFVSDVTILNPQGSRPIDDLKMYYTTAGAAASSAKTTSLPAVPGQVNVQVADVVKNVFSGSNEVGTVQIRTKDAAKLSIAATVLTSNSAAGTFGNTIPVFHSDRSSATGTTLVLTGLRKDATTHTNLYIQETAGSAATLQTDFLAADGSTVSSRTDSVDGFKLLQVINGVPANAAVAVITNTSTAGGKIAAYATPVDEASGDTWALADWSKQLGYTTTEATIVPVAGVVHGINNTLYRTDLSITNRGTTAASGTLRYISRAGEKMDRSISLGGKQTDVIADVIGTRFGVTDDSVGFLLFTPVTGSFAISSRTFTTLGGKPDTFGTGVPTLAAASALKTGGVRPIAGLADSTSSAVFAARPGTTRTNFALMETTGKAVTVRITFRYTFPAGARAQGIGSASRDYPVNPNGFLLLNSISREILGSDRLQFGDLTNTEADFQVIDGDGAVMLFTSSIDNATGDSTLRTE